MAQTKPQQLRLSVFGGPLFRADDREFVASGAPVGTPKVRIPREFFKIVAYRDSVEGGFKAHAFILSQAKLLQGNLEGYPLKRRTVLPARIFIVQCHGPHPRVIPPNAASHYG